MELRSTELGDLKKRIKLYSKKGFEYTIRKLQREHKVEIHLINTLTSKSYCTPGRIYLGTIMDEHYTKVLFHEIQHLDHFDKDNEDAESLIIPW